jgi:hypothetical protein
MKAQQPPSGTIWLHEIKWDGFRVIARKVGKRVKLYSRPGNDLTWRFPLVVETAASLRFRSCIIDGEAVACGKHCVNRLLPAGFIAPCLPCNNKDSNARRHSLGSIGAGRINVTGQVVWGVMAPRASLGWVQRKGR